MSLNELYELNDGHQLPKIGLGTFQIRGYQGVDRILNAIQIGYRLIDTSVISELSPYETTRRFSGS